MKEILWSVCERRGIGMKDVEVYGDTRTPIALTTEASRLGGKHLRVRAKDERTPVIRATKSASSASSLLKASSSSSSSSGSYRKGTNKLFNSSADDATLVSSSGGAGGAGGAGVTGNSSVLAPVGPAVEGPASNDGSLKVSKSAKQLNRWSGLFSNSFKDKDKMDQLVEHLKELDRGGGGKREEEVDVAGESLYALEEDWRDVVNEATEVKTERKRQQQTAIWELLQTEAAYINTIRVITDLFRWCLESLQRVGILTEIDNQRLFGNVEEIHEANDRFWREGLHVMIEASRNTMSPLNPLYLRSSLLSMEDLFAPYMRYCLDQTSCQHYCRELDHDNELFKAYLAAFIFSLGVLHLSPLNEPLEPKGLLSYKSPHFRNDSWNPTPKLPRIRETSSEPVPAHSGGKDLPPSTSLSEAFPSFLPPDRPRHDPDTTSPTGRRVRLDETRRGVQPTIEERETTACVMERGRRQPRRQMHHGILPPGACTQETPGPWSPTILFPSRPPFLPQPP
ncbi:unnamed protein product, partial [Darwinula stevensoni]